MISKYSINCSPHVVPPDILVRGFIYNSPPAYPVIVTPFTRGAVWSSKLKNEAQHQSDSVPEGVLAELGQNALSEVIASGLLA
jgi:hypothetical protein